MTSRLLASGSARVAQTLWTIILIMTMGLSLSGCEGFSMFGDKPKPVISEAPRQTTIMPPPSVPGPPVPVAGQVRIAILLPLSHPAKETRAVAQALLEAAQMGMFDMGARTMMLLPRDTGPTPETAAAAANDAIDKGAELILGPLLANDVRAVAPVARARNVPVIAFSTDRTVAGDGVFLLSFLPEQEVSRIVSYAASKGLGKFAALVPSTPYGQRVEEAFRNTVMQSGRELVAVQNYQPNPQALEPAVKAIAKSGFDTIFLPEGGTMLRSLGPILTINGVDARKIQLLGTGLWDDPAVARETSLMGGWYAVPPPEQRLNFISRYQQLYGAKPPRIASLAYDAVALSATLAGGQPGKRYTRTAIADPNGFAGIDGIFRFRSDGMTERGLAVMEVSTTGQLNVVSPAANTFQSQGF
ncbi:MAG: penicillin-binding protein activator [Alphaproteobacteria bacterium]|nr:penicillin-binding protein activator [Alphaproteobacteria bacterium]